MRDIESVVAELRNIYGRDRSHKRQPDRLANEDIERWSGTLNLSRSEFYDRIALFLARGFQNSQLPFAFCDAVANDLHAVITFANEARPALFWKIFLAFDEGEYRHRNDEPEANPVERYTRPMLAEILSEHAVERSK
jgi:hypothetical protein